MKNVDLSELLIKRHGKICTSSDLQELFGNGYLSQISRMTNSGWIVPLGLFRGMYYVLDPAEREKNSFGMDGFQILIIALNRALGREWYFGRMTALHLLGIVHQPVSVSYIMNRKYRKSVSAKVLGEVVFSKTSLLITASCGIENREYRGVSYSISNPERTMIDYIGSYLQGHTTRDEIVSISSLLSADKNEMRVILSRCNRKVLAERVESVVESIL